MPEGNRGRLARRRGGLITVPAAARLARCGGFGGVGGRKLTKLLLNVTVQGSLGPVQVVMSPENTVGELIRSAVEIYDRERRRPLMGHTDPDCFELHYSQFSLESLRRGEKVMNLGSRNFFLCQKSSSSSRCKCNTYGDQTRNILNFSFPMIRLMDFLL